MKRHTLDTYPVPKDETPMFINEPWIIVNFSEKLH